MLKNKKSFNTLINFSKALRRSYIKNKTRPKKRFFMPKKVLKEKINNIKERLLKVNAGKISDKELVNIVFDFCEVYSGVKFHPYQEQFSKRLIRSVIDNDGEEITALFSRQSGKSETVATTVGGMMIILPRLAQMPMFANDTRINRFADGLWVGIFAPTLRQAQITYGRMKTRLTCKQAQVILSDPEFNYGFSTSNGQTVALTNGSFATCISASEGSQIEGESFKFIICEECQDISDYKIKKSIHPMGAAYNSTIAKIGTATTFKGDFYDAIQRNKQRYEDGEIKLKNHFEYNYKVVMKYNDKYAKYVEKEKYRLGENSDEFQMAYNLKWILERGMFIDIDKFEKNNSDPLAQRIMSDFVHEHVGGIDLASVDDSTVVTIVQVDWDNPVIQEEKYDEETGELTQYNAYNTIIKDWLEIQGTDYEEQYHLIIDYLSHFRMGKLVVDATKESSIAHRLRANLPYEVIPFVFGSKTKSELYKNLDTEIKSGRAKYPASKEVQETKEYSKFLKQLADLQKDYRGSYLVVSHPPIKGAHDDYPDSWALAVYGATEKGQSFVVECKDENPFFKQSVVYKSYYKKRNNFTARRR